MVLLSHMIFLSTHKFPLRPSSGQKSTQDDQSSSVGLISGVTVFIALLIGIIVGFIVYRRCLPK